MKQIFIALVLINVGFALLQLVFGADDVQAAASEPAANVKTLAAADLEALINSSAEASSASAEAVDATAAKAKEDESETAAKITSAPSGAPDHAGDLHKVASAEIPMADESSCSIAGPFPKKDEATDLVNKLADLDIASEVQPRNVTLLPDYMVYVGPQPSADQARKLAAEFAAQNIDSHVIGRGNLQNALSLGVFSQAPFADSLLEELREQGYDANIATMSLNRRGFQVRTATLPKPVRSRLIAADTPIIDCPTGVLGAEAVAAAN